MIVIKAGVRFLGTPQLDPSKIASFIAAGIWTETDLRPHGLAVAAEFSVPEGKVAIGEERFVQDEDGHWKQEFDVEDAPLPIPESVTPRQARLALEAAGLTAQVEAAVTAAGSEARITWDYALEIRRDNLMIASLAEAVGITSEQLDDLFIQAARL